mmetsp:Transcript_12477/g.31424  ORF Transcript_12477/g.31424 Transcript_12477/m.31424 type:complete len:394 (+) Transcript_12477:331-1512(+)
MLSDTARHHEMSSDSRESVQERVRAAQASGPTSGTCATHSERSLPFWATAATPASVSLAQRWTYRVCSSGQLCASSSRVVSVSLGTSLQRSSKRCCPLILATAHSPLSVTSGQKLTLRRSRGRLPAMSCKNVSSTSVTASKLRSLRFLRRGRLDAIASGERPRHPERSSLSSRGHASGRAVTASCSRHASRRPSSRSWGMAFSSALMPSSEMRYAPVSSRCATFSSWVRDRLMATWSLSPRPHMPSSRRCSRGVAASCSICPRLASSTCVRSRITTSAGAPATNTCPTSAVSLRRAAADCASLILSASGMPSRLSMQSTYSVSSPSVVSNSVATLRLRACPPASRGVQSTSSLAAWLASMMRCLRASSSSARPCSSCRALAHGPRVRASEPPV